MATMLQSCVESQLSETRALQLKFPSLEQALRETQPEEKPNPDRGCWSILETLTRGSHPPKEEQPVYVHPMVKRSCSLLSEKSLEMCTENLGSETGTDIMESSIFSLSPWDSSGSANPPTREQPKPRQLLANKKASPRSFPPPLTTIRGSKSLQVRPHRQDGRLLIQAVNAPSRITCFHAERTEGRLRLSLFPDYDPYFDAALDNEGSCWEDDAVDDDDAPEEEEDDDDDQDQDASDGYETDAFWEEEDSQDPEEDWYGHEEEDEEQEDQEDEDQNRSQSEQCWAEETDGNKFDIGVDMGLDKIKRPSRCKEGERENKGLFNMEPFWVAS